MFLNRNQRSSYLRLTAIVTFFVSAPVLAAPSYINASRDPFTNTEVIYSELGGSGSGQNSDARGFIPNRGVGQTPKMELKGFVDGKQPLAMLEIEGVKRVYHVRQGDEIDLRIYKIPVVIQIIEVNKLGVKIRTGTFNQVLVVK